MVVGVVRRSDGQTGGKRFEVCDSDLSSAPSGNSFLRKEPALRSMLWGHWRGGSIVPGDLGVPLCCAGNDGREICPLSYCPTALAGGKVVCSTKGG